MPQKLIQMFLDNQKQKTTTQSSYRMVADGDEATIYVYDVISSWFGISAEQFIEDLSSITASTIHLRVNSPGGEVFEARAMHTALREHPAKVIAHVDSLAASSASFLIMAADEIEISEGAFIMIHNAWTLMLGNAKELRSEADLLEKIDGTIANDYAKRTGESREQIDAWMQEEKWIEGQEAVDLGFADRVAGSADVENRYNLSAYSNVPQALTEAGPPDIDRAAALQRAENERRLALFERNAAKAATG